MSRLVPPDPWTALGARTPARVALGRCGASLPTRAVLDFSLGHARARDAVHAPFDAEATLTAIEALGLRAIAVASAAGDRATYLRRPDLGRRLDTAGAARLSPAGADIAVVLADGLSSTAVHRAAVPLLRALKPLLDAAGLSLAPVVVASQARVALGDEIGAALGARLVVVLIGERPGLSSPDSLGAYVTFGPRPGRTDAERNCVSNIRDGGLPSDRAAARIAWLIREALRTGQTGVSLKDESGLEGLQPPQSAPSLQNGA
jgi:ethanolamine ammonia-lyase small subunit